MQFANIEGLINEIDDVRRVSEMLEAFYGLKSAS